MIDFNENIGKSVYWDSQSYYIFTSIILYFDKLWASFPKFHLEFLKSEKWTFWSHNKNSIKFSNFRQHKLFKSFCVWTLHHTQAFKWSIQLRWFLLSSEAGGNSLSKATTIIWSIHWPKISKILVLQFKIWSNFRAHYIMKNMNHMLMSTAQLERVVFGFGWKRVDGFVRCEAGKESSSTLSSCIMWCQLKQIMNQGYAEVLLKNHHDLIKLRMWWLVVLVWPEFW